MSNKAYHRVANKILALIDSGQFAPKSRLPPERELAARFEVSRTTVREALLALEASHIVKIRDRSGAYVLKPSDHKKVELAQLQGTPGPYEVLQLRRLIEGEAAFIAALNAPDSVIARITAACEASARLPADDTPEFHEANRQFHLSIVVASENSLFASLLEFLWEQKSGPLWENWYRGTRSRQHRTLSVEHAREITRAIQDRRAQAARTAMHRHIDTLIERFLAYQEPVPGRRRPRSTP